ncbi:MAG TPA: carboxymuconolactone decarboxylase family protein [Casimicrobiaceae bacterium]|nr:carboxymuconolactone decarboxylase family protein [Casimicrobiaceae bacterium]
MSNDYREITRTTSGTLSKFRKNQPEVMKNFDALAVASLRDGALSEKTKELIALALGVAGHCDACIAYHVRTLVRLGVTRPEFEEALGVCVYMGGGPSLMYAADALAAYEQYSAAAQPVST